jgi:copper chaperone CopZ
MKTLFTLLAAIASLSLLVGCEPSPVASGPSTADAPAIAPGDVNTVSFDVPGMTCEGCAAMVEETLAGAAGVEACTVDLEAKLATCKVDREKFKAEDVLKALAEAGYKDSTLHN